MFQIRIHGRGGQGVVTAAEMMSIAAFEEGSCAQAFPSFGSERTGAPVVAFCRISDKEIRLREPIMEPDAVIIQDRTLLRQIPVFSGLKKDGYIIINTNKNIEELEINDLLKGLDRNKIFTIPATELSIKHVGRPVPNVPLIGGFAAASGVIKLEAVIQAINQKFSGKVAENNIAAATEAYEIISSKIK